jgi:hypothetical protein
MNDDKTVRDMLVEVATDVKWIRVSLDEIKETHDELEGRVRELEGWRREQDAAGNSSDRREHRFSLGALVFRFFGL